MSTVTCTAFPQVSRMLEHKDYVNKLLGYYGELLTAKQQEIMNYYFAEDLSLAEIAENLKISRSAVLDSIKRSEAILEHYEEVLKLLEQSEKRLDLLKSYSNYKNSVIKQLISELVDLE